MGVYKDNNFLGKKFRKKTGKRAFSFDNALENRLLKGAKL